MRGLKHERLTIVDASELTPAHHRFVDIPTLDGKPVFWRGYSGLPSNQLERWITRPRIARYRAAFLAASSARQANAMVTHLPNMTAAVSSSMSHLGVNIPHLAFSFNFTDIPTGKRYERLERAFARVSRFHTFSNFEAQIYPEVFNLDPEKFVPLSWTQDPPVVASTHGLPIQRPYICSIGGEGRDYRTLIKVASKRPQTKFVVIARPDPALVNAPSNVSAYFNLPAPICWSVALNADMLVLPLRNSDTCCGHITIVSARQLGIPILTTFSHGIKEYVEGYAATLSVPVADVEAMADAVDFAQLNVDYLRQEAQRDRQVSAALYDRRQWNEPVSNFLRETLIHA